MDADRNGVSDDVRGGKRSESERLKEGVQW
jgi:hypothetical protein